MDYKAMFDGFIRERGIKKVISFSGGYVGSDQGKLVERCLRGFLRGMCGKPIAVLTGGTDYNFPGLATRVAKDLGFNVIGVLPEKGFDDRMPGLDLEIVVSPIFGESTYGDETGIFVKCSDAMVVLGGGPGAGVEVLHAIKYSQDLVYRGKAPICIAPARGFGGIADLLINDEYYQKFPQIVMDTTRLNNGYELAVALSKRLLI